MPYASRTAAVVLLGLAVLGVYLAVRHMGPSSAAVAHSEGGGRERPKYTSIRDVVKVPPPAGQQTDGGADATAADGTGAGTAQQDGAGGGAGEAQAQADEGKPAVTGRVVFEGEPPAAEDLPVGNIPQCAALHADPPKSDRVVVNDNGTLANVLVRVTGGLPAGQEFPPPSKPAAIDQRGCIYTPHVVGVMVGQTLLIKNSDPFMHNVNASGSQTPFNIAQPNVDPGKPVKFKAPETFPVQCNVHPWMQAYICVVDNPFFAVTGADGTFTIRGLPPGEYTLTAWHELFGEQTQTVTVTPDKPGEAEFKYSAEGADAGGASREQVRPAGNQVLALATSVECPTCAKKHGRGGGVVATR